MPAYAVFALAVGVLAGALLKRTVAAMSAALLAFVAARLAVSQFLRPHFVAAENDTATGLTPSKHAHDWVLNDSLVDAVGRQITAARENLAIVHAQQARVDAQEYLLSLGWRRAVSFQPSDRFWTFQAVEAGIFLALAVAMIAHNASPRAENPRVTELLDRSELLRWAARRGGGGGAAVECRGGRVPPPAPATGASSS